MDMSNIDGYWHDSIALDYIYTLGVAGERFFREALNGRIMATRCDECSVAYLPPRLYCRRCFRRLDRWVEVEKRGIIYSYTYVSSGNSGNSGGNDDGDGGDDEGDGYIAYALIRFDGVDGGLICRIINKIEDLKIGVGVAVDIKVKEIAIVEFVAEIAG
ncbi:MAG: zinc ribbon domain-containing protein [Candidatus Nitrosocaldus sp.]